MAMAVGQMGLSRDDYLDSTPFEFKLIYAKFMDKLTKDRESELYQKMFVARLQVFTTLCPPKGKRIKITDLFLLPGEQLIIDDERRARKSDKKRFEALRDRWA